MKTATSAWKTLGMAFITATVLLSPAAPACQAAKISQFQNDWRETEFIGRVEMVSPAGDYLVVGERRVFLVDLTYQHRRYLTNILDSNGREIPFDKIVKDSWVFIRAGALPDLTYGARDIYLLPRELSDKEAKRYPALWVIPPWGRVAR